MSKNIFSLKARGVDSLVFFILFVLFLGTLGAAWLGAMSVRQTISENSATLKIDPGALVAVEKLRFLGDAKISDRRTFFLMGSKSIFDKQKSESQEFADSLASFQKKYKTPGVDEIINDVKEIGQREDDFFKQGMEFREKQTESKIVAQFYNAKTSPLVTQLNGKFDELARIHTAGLAEARHRAQKAESDAKAMIPRKMLMLTVALVALFVAISFMIFRIMLDRRRLLRERDRLVSETKNAILSRDEVIAAVSYDLKDPISKLGTVAEELIQSNGSAEVVAGAENLKAISIEMQNSLGDIVDQKRADLGDLSLRLEQLDVSEILERAQVTTHPLAKSRDVTVQFDSGNHSVLAYADLERVHRVLVNLIGNAIKFSPKHSKVLVKVKSDPQFASISVIDHGFGIPADRIQGIFDNFWQAKKTSGQGAGIGLTVVKSIIEAHSGTVRAENNKVDRGTTVTFTLPRRRPTNAKIKKPGVRTVPRQQISADN